MGARLYSRSGSCWSAPGSGDRSGLDFLFFYPNVRNRFLDSAAKVANAELRAAKRGPMPDLTPQSLRRTFISLLLVAGADVPYVMAQAGHTDPKMTLGLCAQIIASETDHGAAMDELVHSGPDSHAGPDRGVPVGPPHSGFLITGSL